MKRSSPIAGQWYEGSDERLRQQIESCFLDKEFGPGVIPFDEKPENKRLLAIISPHAGYVYSGPIAAHSYYELYRAKQHIDLAIVLGPNHRGLGSDISIYPEGVWEFPMGNLEISEDLIQYAQRYDFGTIASKVEFDEYAHQHEHSIDIQFPFLQYLYGSEFTIMPVCLADQSMATTLLLGGFLDDILKDFDDKEIAIVASTDLSHESNYSYLLRQDEMIRDVIIKGEAERFDQIRRSENVTMCGYGGVNALMGLKKIRNETRFEAIAYANSGMITGRTSGNYTVGYFAAKLVDL